MDYWIDDRQLTVLTQDSLLFGSYPKKKLNEYKLKLDQGAIPIELMGFRLDYIKYIETQHDNSKIKFELGRRSKETIEFRSSQLKQEVLDKIIETRPNFIEIRPRTSKMWLTYFLVTAYIVAVFYCMTSGHGDFRGGATPSAQAIGYIMTWFSNTFSKELVLAVGMVLIIWRTVILILNLRKIPKTLRLKQK
ncbi:hypothetical protein LVD15_19400 [Fulvivirga maritima]|uniref:hypothetical protein n=1 Tax=Fulvivirga maritima TaxID=2904247 RepID=UPI001F4533B8|nr:hypothetical protein [Fulvivirga maritima]UII25451.1 hypothetical protein LVD15_19400 [Fulvivirga maritima]